MPLLCLGKKLCQNIKINLNESNKKKQASYQSKLEVRGKDVALGEMID